MATRPASNRQFLAALPILLLAPSASAGAGQGTVVNDILCTSRLEINAERPVSAAPEHDLTLTIDDVGLPLRPGIYKGAWS